MCFAGALGHQIHLFLIHLCLPNAIWTTIAILDAMSTKSTSQPCGVYLPMREVSSVAVDRKEEERKIEGLVGQITKALLLS